MDKLQGFFCQLHKNSKANYLFIDQQDNNLFKCSRCKILQNISSQKLISIQDVLDDQDSDKIIHNWPPNLSQEIQDTCSKFQFHRVEEINQFFDALQSDITSLLQQQKKYFILHINELDNVERQAKQTYKDISQVKKLQQILLSQKSDQIEISTKIKTLYSEMAQILHENQEKLQKPFLQYEMEYTKVQMEQLQGIKHMILSLLKRITIKDKEDSEENIINNKSELLAQNQPQSNLNKNQDNQNNLIFEDILDVSISIFKNYFDNLAYLNQQKKNSKEDFQKLQYKLQENLQTFKLDKQLNKNFINEISAQLKDLKDKFSKDIIQIKDFNINQSILKLQEKK